MATVHNTAIHHKNVPFKVKATNDDGTFSGYASVFGNVDSYNEVVAPGAFAASLATWRAAGDPMPVLWQHQAGQPIGGSDVLTEDEHGLATDGYLLLDAIPQARMAQALMKKRIVKGLSIGYYVNSSTYDEQTGVRTLNDLDLVEYSVVTFPANNLAQIDSVKSMLSQGKLPTFKEFENFLCEAGFSNSQAKAIASRGLTKLLGQCEADGNTAKAIDLLSKFSLT
jgi:uncharacterized protein